MLKLWIIPALLCGSLAAQSVRITSSAPRIRHVGDYFTVQVEGPRGYITRAWLTGAGGEDIPTRVPSLGGNAILVPPGAVSGPLKIEWTTESDRSTAIASTNVIIYPRLRLRASRQRASSGETVTFDVVAKDVEGFDLKDLKWRADFGDIDASGRYTVPGVEQSRFTRIWACIEPGIECTTAIIEILPFRLETDPLVVDLGKTVRLKAIRGSTEVPVRWSAFTKNFTIAPDGTLVAGNGSFDGGRALVLAQWGNLQQTFEFHIRGFGGYATSAEYNDWLGFENNLGYGRLPLGVFHDKVFASGDWFYAIASSTPSFLPSGAFLDNWMDVYKMDANRMPVWVTAIDAPKGGLLTSAFLDGQRLVIAEGWSPGGAVTVYDVSAGIPRRVSRETFSTGTAPQARSGDFSCAVDPETGSDSGANPPALQLILTSFPSGITRKLPLQYEPVYRGYGTRTVCGDGWAAVHFAYSGVQTGNSFETILFDTRGEQAEPFAALPLGGFNFSITVMGKLLILGNQVYEVQDRDLRFRSELPGSAVMSVDRERNRLLISTYAGIQSDGIRVVDLTDPANPRISAQVVHPTQFPRGGAIGNDYFVLGGGMQNISVYPIRWEGGPRLLSRFESSPAMNDARAKDGYLIWTGAGWGARGRNLTRGILEVYDLARPPFESTTLIDRPGDEVGWAIDIHGDFAYVGTDTNLLVYDVRSARTPVERLVIPAPAIALARRGNYLYAASYKDKDKTLLVYDISNPAQPRLVNTLTLPEFGYSITVQAGFLAVALGKAGLRLYSLADPARPALWSQVGSTAWGVASSPTHLYVAADSSGLQIYEVRPPSLFQIVGGKRLGLPYDNPGSYYPNALSVSYDERGLVWMPTTKDGRVYGIDVREPSVPRHIAEFPTQLGAYSALNAVVQQGMLFIAGNLAAFDVSSPQNVGLYDFHQSLPGTITPDRLTDKAPFYGPQAIAQPEPFDHPKAKLLREKTAHLNLVP